MNSATIPCEVILVKSNSEIALGKEGAHTDKALLDKEKK